MKYIKIPKLYLYIFITVLLHYWVYKSGLIEYVDYKIYDFYSKKLKFNTNEQNLTQSVVIVDIDQKSIDALGQWPWSRIIDAQLIGKIQQAYPANIGIDILFNQPDKSSINSIKKFYKKHMDIDIKIEGLKDDLHSNDQIFADTLSRSKITLALCFKNDLSLNKVCDMNDYSNTLLKDAITTYNARSILCNTNTIHNTTKSFGFMNTHIDKDGVMRRVPLFINYQDTIIPSFALANLLAIDKNIKFLTAKSISIMGHTFHTDKHSHVLLNFYKKSWYKHVSAIDVLEGKISKEVFTGKNVLIGTSLIGHNDRHIITTGEMFYGVDIHATLIENILNNHLIWQPHIFKIINILFALFISIGIIILLNKKNYYALVAVTIFTLILPFLISLNSFHNNIYVSIAYLWIPLLIHFTLFGFALLFIYDHERKYFYKELTKSHTAALESMVMVVETRDFETGAHIIRTKEYIRLLALKLKEKGIYKKILTDDFIDTIYRAAPLHDIGKVGIPDSILKKSGKLNEQEYKIIQNHPILGMKIISNAIKAYNKNEFLIAAYNITYYHHEKWDGSGYPMKLKGKDIPLEARLMALVDVYDALISKRCYKEAYSFEKSENIIINESGKHFEPQIVDAFVELKDEFKQIVRHNNQHLH